MIWIEKVSLLGIREEATGRYEITDMRYKNFEKSKVDRLHSFAVLDFVSWTFI